MSALLDISYPMYTKFGLFLVWKRTNYCEQKKILSSYMSALKDLGRVCSVTLCVDLPIDDWYFQTWTSSEETFKWNHEWAARLKKKKWFAITSSIKKLEFEIEWKPSHALIDVM